MKYGLFIFTDDMERARKDRPCMNALPQKCCLNCDNWIQFDSEPDIGTCTAYGNEDGDSIFTWADDLCEKHQWITGG